MDDVCRNYLYAASVPPSSPGDPGTGPVTSTSPHWRESIPGLEGVVQKQVNQYREFHSLSTLEYVLTIAQVARGHSAHVSAGKFFDHVTPEGQAVDDRFAATGLYCGENIVMLPRATSISSVSGVIVYRENDILQMAESDLAEYIVQSWIESPGHLENMLVAHYQLGGVGIHYNESDEQLFATHNMCST